MELQGKIVREEYFPFLVLNGIDPLGMVVWVDYGNYFKVYLKSKLNKNERTQKKLQKCR
jgi:hypothetical protein